MLINDENEDKPAKISAETAPIIRPELILKTETAQVIQKSVSLASEISAFRVEAGEGKRTSRFTFLAIRNHIPSQNKAEISILIIFFKFNSPSCEINRIYKRLTRSERFRLQTEDYS